MSIIIIIIIIVTNIIANWNREGLSTSIINILPRRVLPQSSRFHAITPESETAVDLLLSTRSKKLQTHGRMKQPWEWTNKKKKTRERLVVRKMSIELSNKSKKSEFSRVRVKCQTILDKRKR